MKTVGIIANVDRDKDYQYTKVLAESILKRGGEVKLNTEIAAAIGLHSIETDPERFLKECDIVISLGGDGTFLKVARIAYKMNLPILGINLGNLGFLTEIDRNDIDKAIESIFAGNYSTEERIMLDAFIYRNGDLIASDIVLNDVVISRGAISRILHVKTYINEMFVDNFPGDGLIVSSPTGSTAYTLSAGGPIVEPDTDLIIVTPICPHILYSRSFVTTGDRSVRAIIDERFDHSAMVTVDGQTGYEVMGGDTIEVKKSKYTVKLICVNSRNFYNVLRRKIYYRGESFRKDEVQ